MPVRHLRAIAAAAAVVATATACAGTTSLDEPSDPDSIVIGTANFTENVTLGYIYAGLLEAEGYDVTVTPNLGSREVIFPALEGGDIDLLPEYQGALLAYLDADNQATTGDDQAAALESLLPEGVGVLPYAQAQDKTSWSVTQETAAEYGLTSLADLAAVNGELVYGGPPEDETRWVGLEGLEEVYGVEFAEFKSLDAGGPLTKGALANGDIDVADLFSSDPAIAENDWITLEDPEGLTPAENIAPLVRTEVVDDKLSEALAKLNDLLTTEVLTELNYQTDIEKENPEDVADAWLASVGLV